MASTCQRGILSCSRCRKRKIKCDRQVPSCGQCLSVKAPCVGISPSAEEIPRSLVQNLEDEIARLERRLPRSEGATTGAPPSPHPGSETRNDLVSDLSGQQHSLRSSILSSRFMRDMGSATTSSPLIATDLLSKVRVGVTRSATRLQKRSAGSTVAFSRHKAQSFLDTQVLRSVQSETRQELVGNYLLIIQAHFPFLDAVDLWRHLKYVSHTLGQYESVQLVAPSYDFLVIYIVLATSLTIRPVDGVRGFRGIATSAALFEEGMGHVYGLTTYPSDLARIQALLLILFYATITPKSANIELLSGLTMRACVESSLHREIPDGLGLDEQTIELRRNIFWTAYCMNRSIFSAVQYPFPSLEDAIEISLPRSDKGGILLGRVHYCRLLTEMAGVHFQKDELPARITFDDWLSHMNDKLTNWYEIYRHDAYTGHESSDFLFARGKMVLHRPSPRTMMPSEQYLFIAFESAVKTAHLYQEQGDEVLFRQPWLSAQQIFEAAMVVLFCLRHGHAMLCTRFSVMQILDMTKLVTANFLTIAEQGWPEISNYAGVYERLLGPLLETVFAYREDGDIANDTFTSAQDAELNSLLCLKSPYQESLGPDIGNQENQLALNPDLLPLTMETDFLQAAILEQEPLTSDWDFSGTGFVPRRLGMGLPVGYQW